jgi:hypothetical protein
VIKQKFIKIPKHTADNGWSIHMTAKHEFNSWKWQDSIQATTIIPALQCICILITRYKNCSPGMKRTYWEDERPLTSKGVMYGNNNNNNYNKNNNLTFKYV